MSNEELVAEIQAGAPERMGELWEQIAGLVKWKARRNMGALESCGGRGVEFEDLFQSGYLALVKAVQTYDPAAGGAFSSWLMYYLQTAFAEAGGYRTERQQNDPLNRSVSLSNPLGDDADSDTLEDITPDPDSAVPFEAVEQRLYIASLRKALEQELDKLPSQQGEAIRQRYFTGATLEQVGESLGISTTQVQRLEENAIRTLREPPHSTKLETFVESRTPYYLRVSSAEFQRTHESAVERIVFLRERLRQISEKSYE